MQPNTHNRLWFILLFCLLAVMLTFPGLLHGYGPGIDMAYVWAYNHLFVHDFTALRELIFTYGPLGFLKFPQAMGLNAWTGFLFLVLLRWLQAVLFLQVLKKYREKLRIIDYLVLLLLLRITSYDLAFASIMLCGGLLAEAEKKWYPWVPGLLLAAVGLYIKFSIGVVAFAVFGAYLAVLVVQKKLPMRQAVWPVLVALAAVWVLGFALSGQAGYAYTYILHALKISASYAAALSLHPENNKGPLWLSLLLLLAYPLVLRKNWQPALFVSLLAGLFIVWKHSIVREESWHIFLLVQTLLMGWLYLIVLSPKRRPWLLVIASVALVGLWRYTYQLGGVRQFLETGNTPASFFDQLRSLSSPTQASPGSEPGLQYALLPTDVRSLIGNQSVDIYPWDLNYAAVNHLNWHPRPGLQSIDFNPWLDEQSANFYRGPQAPEFVLWHRSNDRFDREMGSFEERYLLSSEPLTVDALLANYEPVTVRHNFTLYRKKQTASPVAYAKGQTIALRFGQMLAVPQTDGLLKADVRLSLNGLGKLVGALYKEPAFFIRYKWVDGSEYYYNVLRHNAPSGIWVQPFVSSLFFPDARKFRVDSIGFFTTQPSLSASYVALTWMYGPWPRGIINPNTYPDTLYHTADTLPARPIQVPPHGFADLFRLSVDSLPPVTVELQVQMKTRTPRKGHPRMVLSIDKDTLNSLWTAAYNDAYLPTQERWGAVTLSRVLDLSRYPGHTLKVYLWNESPMPFEASDAKLSIRSYPHDAAVFSPHP